MNIEFFYFLLCMQIPRLFLNWKDATARSKNRFYPLIFSLLIEVLLLLPLISLEAAWILGVFLFVFHALQFIKVAAAHSILKRILEFVFLVVAGSFVFGLWQEQLVLNETARSFIRAIIDNNALLVAPETDRAGKILILYSFGVVTLVNEINNVIRYILDLVKTVPVDSNQQVDTQELYRGKIIGVAERILFFFFVITDNYASIAFILAAKAVTRHKELDNKNFAEYVLIGTLLSASLSIFWAFFIAALGRLL